MISDIGIDSYANINRSLGRLSSFDKTAHGLVGYTDFGIFEIIIYNPSIIRVRVSHGNFNDHSYAIIAHPTEDHCEILENETDLKISTEKIELVIGKDPVRLTFKNKNGEIINQDDDAFGISWIGEHVTNYKVLQKGERFIGLGEKTGNLDRRGSGYVNWNTDSFAYSNNEDPLYASIPFYIGLHNNLCYGIYLDNSYKSHFNFGASNNRFSSFGAECGDMNYYFIHGESVSQIIQSYTHLTGRMELPPLWSLGYQQCRYSYYPDTEVLSVADTFRYKDIPSDVIVLDIHYMDEYKIFTWDKKRFPDPKGMVAKLKEKGFKVIVMCDPGIKVEDGYEPYEDGKEKGIFLKYPDGTDYTGEVWPGWCHFPDFTNPKARKWWADKFKDFTDIGIEGYWNDMNEIATWGQKLPDLIEFDFEGRKSTTAEGRNIYGLLMAKSSYEGAKQHLNGKRVFSLTRAAFSGIQRYSAIWTGDNVANDEHMLLGVRLVNSLGISGIPFAGYDTGGFAGEASVNLFGRWITIGAFSPYFRGHSVINSRDSEPWSYGEEVEEISRNYIKLRYKLLPYIYSSFYEANQNGMPICRSLAIDYSFDDNIYDERFQNQYLFGSSILVAPVSSKESISRVYLPEGEWYDLHNGKYYEGKQVVIIESEIERLPLFIKAGAIIPLQSAVSSTSEKPEETLYLHIYKGFTENSFELYEDDGITENYKDNKFQLRQIIYTPQTNSIIINEAIGELNSVFKKVKLTLHGFEFENGKILLNGSESPLNTEQFCYLKPITNFDPQGSGGSIEKELVQVVEFEYSREIINIAWN